MCQNDWPSLLGYLHTDDQLHIHESEVRVFNNAHINISTSEIYRAERKTESETSMEDLQAHYMEYMTTLKRRDIQQQ